MGLMKLLKPSSLKQSLSPQLMDIPFITMKGNQQISIENEYTLLSFSATEIKLRYQLGIMTISGENLMIRTMYADEMICQGVIIQVSFQEHG
jgi:sporulation protein YqfC